MLYVLVDDHVRKGLKEPLWGLSQTLLEHALIISY
jgi:hypothetical protein